MTQRDDVLRMLRNGPTCSTVFLQAYIPRFAARIHELRGDGYEVARRRCRAHPWHQQYEYVLVERVESKHV